MRFILQLACVVEVFAAVALAQSGGSITGRISNLPGDAVPNAPVQLTNLTTHAIYKAVSSEKGVYTLGPLPSGDYEVSVAVPGYNAYEQKGLKVAAGQTVSLDIRLMDFQLDTLGDGREFQVDRLSVHATPKGPTPRTRDGKPDFTGVWYAQRPVDPSPPKMLPWAEKLTQERIASNSKDAPGAHCLPRGITNAGALFPYEMVQTPKRLIMIFEDDVPSHRTVYLDERHHPSDPNPNFMGHSIGHWEKDTLVIDTVGFNDRTWLDNIGHPHTEMLHVVERLRRPDLGHLEIEFTLEDPGAYLKPWVVKRAADLNTSNEVGEYVCEERDAQHLVGK